MQTQENFQIEVEFKYCEDCKSLHYKAVVKNSENQIVGTSDDWFKTKQQAQDDGRRMIEGLLQKQKLSAKGVDFTQKLFKDPMGRRMFFQDKMIILGTIFGSSIIGSIFFAMERGREYYVAILSLACLCMLVIYGIYLYFSHDRIMSNCYVYAAADRRLYRLCCRSENKTVEEIINDKRNCQIQQVLFIRKKGDRYKIRCLVTGINGQKAKEKSLWLRPGFNEYKQLVGCFYYLLENPEP